MRIDYGKLRHLLTVNRQLNGNFDLLRHLIGAGWVDGELRSGFPLEELDQRDNLVSLLHYFGLQYAEPPRKNRKLVTNTLSARPSEPSMVG